MDWPAFVLLLELFADFESGLANVGAKVMGMAVSVSKVGEVVKAGVVEAVA